jgi:hypothetical protein
MLSMPLRLRRKGYFISCGAAATTMQSFLRFALLSKQSEKDANDNLAVQVGNYFAHSVLPMVYLSIDRAELPVQAHLFALHG